MATFWICILALVTAFVSVDAAIINAPDERLFNVVDYGAKPGDKANNVEAFTRAWGEACNYVGKATVLIPIGEFTLSAATFSGPCKSVAPIAVQLSGTVKASMDLSLYPKESWLLFQDISGLVIFGDGTIDGQGNNTWHTDKCADTNGKCTILPASLVLNQCTNVLVRSITSLNPKGFHISVTECKNVQLEELHILAPESSSNTDGIHISKSDQVSVTRSLIQTGDDCIGIIQGNTHISISEVTCGPGHGISVGSLGKHENERDVVGITVVNCTLKGTDNGIRIKTFPYNGKATPIKATGFLFKDIVMDNVKNPIIIDQDYCDSKKHCFDDKPSNIEISDIEFNNIVGTSQTEPAVSLVCSSAKPCKNVTFDNINLIGVNGAPAVASCSNANVNMEGLQLPPVNC
uniref:Exopolygalacturonase n=1 Tax=Fagopyrum esculentum subsp. esculentum TaxID=1050352 RepID=A0A5A4PWW2_FAGES|nr:exopolygalacturonase [Fagopyrum esculentum subsp. esculentum]